MQRGRIASKAWGVQRPLLPAEQIFSGRYCPGEQMLSHLTEIVVSAENWHEERDRLAQLLEGIESGKITHIDQNHLRQLQATNPKNVAATSSSMTSRSYFDTIDHSYIRKILFERQLFLLPEAERNAINAFLQQGDDLAQAKTIALDAIRAVDGVLADPASDVLVWDLGGSSKNNRIRWWTKPARGGVLRIRDAVLKGVAEAIARAGIDLPFPTQVVLFHDQTEEADGDRTRQREGWPAGKNPPRPRRLPPPEAIEAADQQAVRVSDPPWR